MKKLALLGLTFLLCLNFAVSRRARNRNTFPSKPRNTNFADKQQVAWGSGTGPAVLDDKTIKFGSKTEELKWKLNQARKNLNVAKQYVKIAADYAKLHKVSNSEHGSVKDLISKTEKVLVHAGDRLGLDYIHFKRSVDEESGKE